ncbi:unnamed protein product [Urochloa humidicola]
MDVEEARLRFALLATAPGSPQDLPIDAMRSALPDIPDMPDEEFAVRRFFPECFLVVFSSQRARDTALHAGGVVVQGVRLSFRQWTRLVRATMGNLFFRVTLEIEGVPVHAWSMRTARKLLAPSCWVQSLEPASSDRTDQSMLKVTVWTDNPSRIPRRKTLAIAEHEQPVNYGDADMQLIFGRLPPYLRQKDYLAYNVLIHLRHVADFRPRPPSPSPGPSPPSSDGDSGHDGNPDRRYGESRGVGPRLQGFPCYAGVEDGDTPPAGAQRLGAAPTRRPLLEAGEPSARKRSPPAEPLQATSTPRAAAPPLSSPAASSPELARATAGPDGPTDNAKAKVGASAHLSVRKEVALSGSAEPAATRQEPAPVSPGKGDHLAEEAKADNQLHRPPQTAHVVAPCTELLPFEAQLPTRSLHVSLQKDPMLLEAAPTSNWMLRPRQREGSPKAKPALRTYVRRGKGHASSTAALPTPTRLNFEHVSREEPQQDQSLDDNDPAPDGLDCPGLGLQSEPAPNLGHSCATPRPTSLRMLPGPALTPPIRGGSSPASPPGTAAAMAATTAFLASVRAALQVPLADRRLVHLGNAMPAASGTVAPLPRRSGRLAAQALNLTVRPSKKGEVLAMRKLGYTHKDEQAAQAASAEFDKFLKLPMQKKDFAALRDMFPLAKLLTDVELVAAVTQAGGEIGAR